MKKIMVLLIAINLWSCGKTKLDTPSATDSSSTSTVTGSTSKCVDNPQCKAMCDGNSFTGDKVECDYEERKNWPYKPHCDKLRACYAGGI